MKKESNEALEAYKIRIDALEIINEAHLAKIEALELLNRNLQFLRDVRNQMPATAQMPSTPAPVSRPYTPAAAPAVLETGEKRGRGRPRKYPVGTNAASIRAASMGNSPRVETRGRKPKGYYESMGIERPQPKAVKTDGEKRGRGRPRKTAVAAVGNSPVAVAAKRPRTSSITRLQVPLEAQLRDMLKEEGYNKATFRALTGILLCLFENGSATVSALHEYIGGSKVTVVRHAASLKKMELLVYEGSRKKGKYVLTAKGRHMYEKLLNA